jgi:hypothetical protein
MIRYVPVEDAMPLRVPALDMAIPDGNPVALHVFVPPPAAVIV